MEHFDPENAGPSTIINNFLFITLTCNAETWNGVIKSSSQIYCCQTQGFFFFFINFEPRVE